MKHGNSTTSARDIFKSVQYVSSQAASIPSYLFHRIQDAFFRNDDVTVRNFSYDHSFGQKDFSVYFSRLVSERRDDMYLAVDSAI